MEIVVLVGGILALVGVLVWIGLLLWAAREDGRDQRRRDEERRAVADPQGLVGAGLGPARRLAFGCGALGPGKPGSYVE